MVLAQIIPDTHCPGSNGAMRERELKCSHCLHWQAHAVEIPVSVLGPNPGLVLIVQQLCDHFGITVSAT
jgi:hypothetical protein